MRICKYEGCDRPHLAKGWCSIHYERVRRTGSPDTPLRKRRPSICKYEGCPSKHRCDGWCGKHYQRVLRHGSPHRRPRIRRECAVDGCDKSASVPGCARGWCPAHYRRWSLTGSVGQAELRKVLKQTIPHCIKCRVRLWIGRNWGEGACRRANYLCIPCVATKDREWAKNNPARCILNRARTRARNGGLPFNLNTEYIRALIDSTPRCPALGTPLVYGGGQGRIEAVASLDRFVGSRGYVMGNVHIISQKANIMKSNGTPEEVRRLSVWMDHVEATGGFAPVSDKQRVRLVAQIMSAAKP